MTGLIRTPSTIAAASVSLRSVCTIKRVTRQRVRYRSLAARKPKELRPDTESEVSCCDAVCA